MHCDGGGLYLQVTASGDESTLRKSWLFRYRSRGQARERQMGLGSLDNVTFAEAREKAAQARKLVADGMDPIEQRDTRRAALALASAKVVTFDECRNAYIKAHRSAWRNTKHAAQWAATLATYVRPNRRASHRYRPVFLH